MAFKGKGVSIQFTNRNMVSSVRRWAKELEATVDEIKSALPLAMEEALTPIFDESQVLVPVDTGRLKDSGFIDVDQSSAGRRLTGTVGYGEGGNPFYTLLVHENLEFRHDPPTQAKFLEEAYNRHADDVEDIMAAVLRSFIATLR